MVEFDVYFEKRISRSQRRCDRIGDVFPGALSGDIRCIDRDCLPIEIPPLNGLRYGLYDIGQLSKANCGAKLELPFSWSRSIVSPP